MPRMNGFDAARQISTMLPGVPIIMHTLYASPQVEIEANKCGIQRVTPKSDGAKLVQAIEAAFADACHTHKALAQRPIKRAPLQ